jgi:hypothetical protein
MVVNMVQTELLQAVKKIKEGSKMIRFIKISSVALGSIGGLLSAVMLINVILPNPIDSGWHTRIENLGMAIGIALTAWLLIYLGLNYNKVVEK